MNHSLPFVYLQGFEQTWRPARFWCQIRRSLLLLLTILLILTISFIYSLPTEAMTEVFRLTNNFYPDVYPQMYGQLLTWQAFMDENPADQFEGDWEVWVGHLPTRQVVRLTDNKGDDLAPKTNGSVIVWQGEGEKSQEIYLFDWSSEITKQLTNDLNEDFLPQIWGDWVVWCAQPQKEGVLQAGEVFLYRISTQTITCLSQLVDPGNLAHDSSPRIGYLEQEDALAFGGGVSGPLVFWPQEKGENNTSFLYHLDTGRFQTVPPGFLWPENRQRSKALQVVSRSDGIDRELFLFQPSANHYLQLTSNEYPDRYPCLQGGWIAWMAGDGESAEIFLALYDPNTPLSPTYDPNPLLSEEPPPDPVVPTSPPPSAEEQRSEPLKPATRCFISALNL